MEKKKTVNLQKLLSKFKPYNGFEVDQYYGVSLLRLKKNDKFSIVLVYDFINGNPKTSSGYIVDSLDIALELVRTLEENRKVTYVKEVQHNDNDIFDEIEGWN